MSMQATRPHFDGTYIQYMKLGLENMPLRHSTRKKVEIQPFPLLASIIKRECTAHLSRRCLSSPLQTAL